MRWEDDFMIKHVPATPEDEVAKFFSPIFDSHAGTASQRGAQ
jgi:hypothetical protein